MTSRLPLAVSQINYPPSVCALTRRHVYAPTLLPTPHSSSHFCSEVFMNATAPVSFPHLAARITNISYTPIIGTRSPYPSDPDFYDGGKTNRNSYSPSFWSPNTSG